MKKKATKYAIGKQEEILAFIISYFKEHGYAPTIREIGEGTGLHSPSTVHTYITRMLIEGIIQTDAPMGSPRAIRVPGYVFRKETKDKK